MTPLEALKQILSIDASEAYDLQARDQMAALARSVVNNPQPESVVLTDYGNDNKKQVRVFVKEGGGMLMIGAEGYGGCSDQPKSESYIAAVDLWEDNLRILLWDDINRDDPKVMSMEQARLENFQPEA